MKTFFVALWLMTIAAGGYGYDLYQQLQAKNQTAAQSLATAQITNADLTRQLASLKDQASDLQSQLDAEKKVSAALRLAASVTPTPNTSPSNATPQSVPTSIPSTVTTLEGTTYTGCVLSHVWPDGISFTHSTGVAKVLFSDLDPSFAATFGYDPQAAKKYEVAQAAQEAQSDALRTQIEGKSLDPVVENAGATHGPAPTPSTSLTADQRNDIQAQIDSLNKDIAFMQREEAKRHNYNTYEIWNGTVNTEGAYAQKIKDEQAQVDQLKAELR